MIPVQPLIFIGLIILIFVLIPWAFSLQCRYPFISFNHTRPHVKRGQVNGISTTWPHITEMKLGYEITVDPESEQAKNGLIGGYSTHLVYFRGKQKLPKMRSYIEVTVITASEPLGGSFDLVQTWKVLPAPPAQETPDWIKKRLKSASGDNRPD